MAVIEIVHGYRTLQDTDAVVARHLADVGATGGFRERDHPGTPPPFRTAQAGLAPGRLWDDGDFDGARTLPCC